MHLYKVPSFRLLKFNIISKILISDHAQKIESNQKSDHSSLTRHLGIVATYLVKLHLLAMFIFHNRTFLIY